MSMNPAKMSVDQLQAEVLRTDTDSVTETTAEDSFLSDGAQNQAVVTSPPEAFSHRFMAAMTNRSGVR